MKQLKLTRKPGFTILELTFALLFITFIMIFCVTTLVQILRMYDKGSAIKQMSQSTRLVNDELARAIRTARSSSEIRYPTVGVFDRICINETMYVWNVLYDNAGASYPKAQSERNDVGGRPVGLAKLKIGPDEYLRCTTSGADLNRTSFGDGDSEILGGSARVVQSSLKTTADGRVYTLDLRIGTFAAQELNDPPADRTITPSKQGADPEVGCKPGNIGNYCFVNQLELTVYAANISE